MRQLVWVSGEGPQAVAHVLGSTMIVALDEADVGRWYMPVVKHDVPPNALGRRRSKLQRAMLNQPDAGG